MTMIPYYLTSKKYIFIDDMPRTNNGNVDKKSPKRTNLGQELFVMEEKILEVIQEDL